MIRKFITSAGPMNMIIYKQTITNTESLQLTAIYTLTFNLKSMYIILAKIKLTLMDNGQDR